MGRIMGNQIYGWINWRLGKAKLYLQCIATSVNVSVRQIGSTSKERYKWQQLNLDCGVNANLYLCMCLLSKVQPLYQSKTTTCYRLRFAIHSSTIYTHHVLVYDEKNSVFFCFIHSSHGMDEYPIRWMI